MLEEGASVRRTEELVRQFQAGGEQPQPEGKKKGDNIIMHEEYNQLRDGLAGLFSSKVQLSDNDKGKGKSTIPFTSDEDLMRLKELFDRMK